MIRLSRRQIGLVGLALTCGVLWAIDAFLVGSSPMPARADESGIVAPRPAEPFDAEVQALLDAFHRDESAPSSRPPGELRDVFARPLWLEPPAPPVVEVAPGPESAPASVPFEVAHRLEGILLGRTRLAVIDGRVFRAGERIDGHQVREILEDRVLLIGPAGTVELVLNRASSP